MPLRSEKEKGIRLRVNLLHGPILYLLSVYVLGRERLNAKRTAANAQSHFILISQCPFILYVWTDENERVAHDFMGVPLNDCPLTRSDLSWPESQERIREVRNLIRAS